MEKVENKIENKMEKSRLARLKEDEEDFKGYKITVIQKKAINPKGSRTNPKGYFRVDGKTNWSNPNRKRTITAIIPPFNFLNNPFYLLLVKFSHKTLLYSRAYLICRRDIISG